jgi:hypothetical protein
MRKPILSTVFLLSVLSLPLLGAEPDCNSLSGEQIISFYGRWAPTRISPYRLDLNFDPDGQSLTFWSNWGWNERGHLDGIGLSYSREWDWSFAPMDTVVGSENPHAALLKVSELAQLLNNVKSQLVRFKDSAGGNYRHYLFAIQCAEIRVRKFSDYIRTQYINPTTLDINQNTRIRGLESPKTP